ncbi:MAG TPA: hypothetical protein P5332_10905 [Ignavibacteriales bacterium]|nr:hypothetical protein [Ignavibacteriales bacterium]
MINKSNDDDSILINPQEIQKRRRSVIVDTVEDDVEIAKKLERSGDKYSNVGGKAIIELETMGRFDMPEVLRFSDFTTQDINDLSLSRQEDLLKVLITILNRCKDNPEVDIQDMLLEEMLEVLIGIKMEFNSVIHEHPWICNCQQGIETNEQIVNKTEIDLRTIQFSSIEDADKDMQKYFSSVFEQLSEEQFKMYLNVRYKNEPHADISKITKEDEIKTLKVIEPIGFGDDEGNIYSFRFQRVKDLLDAQKMVQFKYAGKIKSIRNKKPTQNDNLLDFKTNKDKELEEIQFQQAKDLVLYAKAFSLVKYNYKDLTKDEAVNLYKKLPRSLLFRVNNFFDEIKFGVNDTREMTCPLCGETSRRSLRQEFNPFEFLPLDVDTVDREKKPTGFNIFIGV